MIMILNKSLSLEFLIWIIPKLETYIENEFTFPEPFDTLDEWCEVLNKMLEGFKSIKDFKENYDKIPLDKYEKKQKKINKIKDKTLKLFRKYFLNL